MNAQSNARGPGPLDRLMAMVAAAAASQLVASLDAAGRRQLLDAAAAKAVAQLDLAGLADRDAVREAAGRQVAQRLDADDLEAVIQAAADRAGRRALDEYLGSAAGSGETGAPAAAAAEAAEETPPEPEAAPAAGTETPNAEAAPAEAGTDAGTEAPAAGEAGTA